MSTPSARSGGVFQGLPWRIRDVVAGAGRGGDLHQEGETLRGLHQTAQGAIASVGGCWEDLWNTYGKSIYTNGNISISMRSWEYQWYV